MARSIIRESTCLVLLALIPAIASAWLHPRSAFRASRGAEIPKVGMDAIIRWREPLLWVDARKAVSFAAGHIPSAVNLTEREWESQLPQVMEVWRPGMRIVVYCDAAGCDASTAVARRLKRELQVEDIAILDGGWQSWQFGSKR